jgi:Cu/Ag efflux protein CusF
MQKTGLLIASLAVLALGLTACSPKAAEPAATAPAPAAAPMANMPMTPAAPAVSGPIMGMGKITAINATAGTVTLDHQAIPAVGWDAMSMGFTAADPAMLKDLKVGDAVSFELKSAAEKTIITKIQQQ